jgi:hypothetical protein
MAAQSLEVDLRQETEYLRNHDAVARQVNERIDLNSNTLALMVRLCLQNEGRFSNGKRKAFLSKGYSADMLAVVESAATGVLAGRADDGEAEDDDLIPNAKTRAAMEESRAMMAARRARQRHD